jgi:hypothetical protein
MPMGQIGIAVLRGDRLALLGQAEAASDRAGRLRANGAVGWPAAARYRSTAPVEQRQLDAILAAHAQCFRARYKAQLRREITTVLLVRN